MTILFVLRRPPISPLFPYPTRFRSPPAKVKVAPAATVVVPVPPRIPLVQLSVPLPGTLRLADPLTVPPLRLKLAKLKAHTSELHSPTYTVSVLRLQIKLPNKEFVPT